jgi:hypothetical protein
VTTWTTTALVAAGMVGMAAAQEPAPRVDDARPRTLLERNTGVVTGCLVKAAEPGQYLLAVVISRDDVTAAAGEPRAVGTSGTSAADPADPVADSAAYRLDAEGSGQDLAAHVGKTVEVTPAAGAAAGATLPVASLRVVDERCR